MAHSSPTELKAVQFTFECAHLVEPLGTPAVKLENFQYTAATWARNTIEVTMNTGERFQFMKVPGRLAIEFVRNPADELLKGIGLRACARAVGQQSHFIHALVLRFVAYKICHSPGGQFALYVLQKMPVRDGVQNRERF